MVPVVTAVNRLAWNRARGYLQCFRVGLRVGGGEDAGDGGAVVLGLGCPAAVSRKCGAGAVASTRVPWSGTGAGRRGVPSPTWSMTSFSAVALSPEAPMASMGYAARVCAPGTVPVRDSKNAEGPVLVFSHQDWALFIDYVSSSC
jgi:hypothetical protein